MWPQYYYRTNGYPYSNGTYPYSYPTYDHQPYYDYRSYQMQALNRNRQQPVRGQASWTMGGQVTKCGKPWSENEYMTAAVGENSPYKCGQSLKIRNLTLPGQREIIVTVVDTVAGYPANKVNLHRNAFVALGASPNMGVIDIEIIPSPQLEEEIWGKYLIEITQMAYPNYDVTDYKFVSQTKVSPTQTRETYEFILESDQDNIKIQGNVVYNPNTDRVVSIDLKEMEHFRDYMNYD